LNEAEHVAATAEKNDGVTRGVAAVELQLVIWNLDLGLDVDMRTLQRPVVPMISYRAVRLSALSDAAVKALSAQNTAQLATCWSSGRDTEN
jgi:hypothetical protein